MRDQQEQCKLSWICPDIQAVLLKIKVSGLKRANFWSMIE